MNASLAGTLVALLLSLTSWSLAHASVLVLVVDETEVAPRAWWAHEDARPVGAFDRALQAMAEGDAGWIEPARGRTAERIASVLRTPRLTPNNARSLAGLWDADVVVMGAVVREAAAPIPWLTLARSALVLEGRVVDVATGAERDALSIRAVALGTTHDEAEAAAAAVLVEILRASVSVTPARASGELPASDLVIVSDGSALPYVELRGVLRDAHPGLLEVREHWATGGALGVELVLDEGVSRDEVLARIRRLTGHVGDALHVVDVRESGSGLVVQLARRAIEGPLP